MRAFLRSNEWSCLRTQKVICLSDCSNSPPSVLAERRFVSTRFVCHKPIPCSGERKSRFGSKEFQQNHRSLAEGITGHTRSSSATEFSGLCPPPSSRQEVFFPRGIVLTQTISQKRQATSWIIVTSLKSLLHNGFRISCFCDFYGNQVETTEFANGDSISFFKTTNIERNIPP